MSHKVLENVHCFVYNEIDKTADRGSQLPDPANIKGGAVIEMYR